MNAIAFSIPRTRLVGVEYWKDGVRYIATIENPKDNRNLCLTMLKRKVAMRQVESVKPVIEKARK